MVEVVVFVLGSGIGVVCCIFLQALREETLAVHYHGFLCPNYDVRCCVVFIVESYCAKWFVQPCFAIGSSAGVVSAFPCRPLRQGSGMSACILFAIRWSSSLGAWRAI
jgi:hypothetical protein